MDFSEIEDALKESIIAAKIAGEKIMQIYHHGFSVEKKEDDSPVTRADIEANEIILSHLKKRFPEAAYLAEESADDLSRRKNVWCFIIDPLDGTKEFVKKTDEFTVNIALVYQQKPVMGMIYAPASEYIYYGIRGQGAWKQVGSQKERIYVSERTSKVRAAVSKSNSPDNIAEIMERYGIKEIIYAGSAIKGCLIAEGKAEIYYRYGKTCEWDTAAMQCIVEEAGGIFRQMDDSEMVYNRENVVNEKGFYILNNIENKLQGR